MLIFRRIFAAVALLCVIATPAFAQKTKAALNTEIGVNFPDNTAGAITPSILRTTISDIINSIMPTAPVVTGNVAIYDGITGLLKDGGTGPAQALTCSTHNWFNTMSLSGVFGCSQPNFTDIAGFIATSQISTNSISYTLETQALSNTVVGNPSGATANKQDMAMPSCSSVGSTLEWTTSTGFGCVTQVANFNGRTGSISPTTGDYTLNQIYNCTLLPQGRLTFLTGTPVQNATTSGATSHFYTPYLGQQVPIYDGTRFICTDTGGELTQTAADSTKSPAAVANNSCYDVFVWNDTGTIRATRGTVWTNTTTRAQALARINGIYTNGTAVTNGPGLNRGTYVGTECSNGTATFDWIVGAAASGGTAASLNAWNQYNRVDTTTTVTDNGGTYTYATATVRQARASAGNQITFVSGNTEDAVEAIYSGCSTSGASGGVSALMGVGLDSTSTFFVTPVAAVTNTTTALSGAVSETVPIAPQLGRHIISANEAVNSAITASFNSGATVSIFTNSNTLSFKFRM
jgi:hypothetical protein